MTYHVQITEGDEKLAHTDLEHWKPWLNCPKGEREITLGLIVHCHIRNRGGLHWNEPLDITVWYFNSDTPRYPSGRPKEVHAVRYRCLKEDPLCPKN